MSAVQTINVRSRVGQDGLLHLDIASGYTNTELDVIVTLHPAASCDDENKRGSWPPGFFENVIGGWEGEPLRREEVGIYEAREKL